MADKTLIFCTLAMLLVVGGASASQATVAELLPQYPRAELAEVTDSRERATHEIIMSSVKKQGGIIRPEVSEFVVGRRLATTWYIPDEQRTKVVSQFYRDRLAALGEILFECDGYDCGSSNYWANKVFNRPILLGPEQYQHYFLTRIETDALYYVATYVALRGTRKLYVHTDVIATETSRQTDGAAIVAALEASGRFVIDAGAEDSAIADIVAAMEQKPLMRIAIVSHVSKQRGESVDQAVARSQARARALVSEVVEMGANQTRIDAYGVGPLAPLERDLVDRTEVVLISVD